MKGILCVWHVLGDKTTGGIGGIFPQGSGIKQIIIFMYSLPFENGGACRIRTCPDQPSQVVPNGFADRPRARLSKTPDYGGRCGSRTRASEDMSLVT